ncbi:tandem-95 repeat protein [Paenarthrobacter sp. DKR-5]|uniref:Ig-like domain-containing protein n=1 Tax=Paenarthrobacter sp. DKR-5 TaxID=2835535 RepID=UPI001BDDAE76|nr:Ig-like domain-containing protein [Paenarthrobacter sp. DKR-5]MBT1002528.1 tandem-95 repeat protein [Paenarthrobacter sp. DKR-5]
MRGLGKRQRTALSATAFSAVGAVLVAGAIMYPGFKTAQVDLNDGGVWVTSKTNNAIGHLNYQSKVLDGAVLPASNSFDVLQNAGTVFMDDQASAILNPIDVPDVKLTSDKKLPGSAEVSFGTDLLAISDRSRGKVWAATPDTLGSFSEQASDPVASVSPGSAVTVGKNDVIYSADVKTGELRATRVDASGAVAGQDVSTLEGLKGASNPQLAVVGSKPVLLDPGTGTLYLPGGRTVHVDNAADARLQQSGPESSFVAVATRSALLKQPLDGSAATRVDVGASGVTTAPVQQDGCVHAAWSGSNKYVRDCLNSADNKKADIPSASARSSLVFRVNRSVVVLNDVNSGNVWMVNQNLQLVNNWDDVIPPTDKSDKLQDKESADQTNQTTLPDRTKPNRPPEVKPDSYGVRAGKTTLLPVLDNDSDPDGDLLTTAVAGDGPGIGSLQQVYGGTGFQITVPAGKSGSDAFRYTASDGRGGTGTAQVSLNVIPPEQNTAPKQKRDTKFTLQSGKSLSQNILSDWADAEGDDMFLVSARSDNPQDEVKTRPDGLLTFQDGGGKPGRRTVTVTVSDGTASAEGKVYVDVRADGALAPVANADHVTAVAGQDLVINPLKNDIDPNAGALRLAQVAQDPNAETALNADSQTLTFRSGTVGAHYLTYLVTNGPASTTGLIRVDVVSGKEDGAPVAVRDVALLPAGGSTLVDVLGNDTDPSGGVLVAQSISVPPGSPFTATLIDHDVVRISDANGASGQLSMKYTVSNGTASATGDISIAVVPAPGKLRPPQAKPDEINVRVNDVATIDVLGNDTDPNGGKLTLDRTLPQPVDGADGRLFAAENTLRFIAGNTPKTVYGVYNVLNESGQKDSAQVTIHILPRDDEHNSRPQPKNLTGRVVAGMSVRVPVPLDGIDPDGDSVQLVGVDQAPSMGTAVAGSGFIDYTAAAGTSGTDTFTYRVRDRIGAENTATVVVGIAPAEEVNQKPLAVDDFLTVRPGRQVAADVLSNDSDPDGDPISLSTNGFTAKPELGAHASDQGRVVFTAPSAEGTETIGYTIHDSKKAPAKASLRVTVSPNAPLRAPIARDDHVTEAETLGKTAVDVPVLKNDEDPDGTTDQLKISFPGNPQTARAGGSGNVIVTLTDQPQLIPYTVTDIDNLDATAVIWVPGKGQQYPTLSKSGPVEVKAGQAVTLNLNDYVVVRQGRSPRLTQADRIKVIGGSATDVIAANGTALTYRALPDYAGPGSVTFEVTDGTGPDDNAGLKSTLTILTKVIPDPNANHPPVFQGSELDVPKGEPATLDLSALATDPDQGDTLKFDFDGARPAGFGLSLDGSTLRATANDAAAVGTRASVPLKVSDGRNEAKATVNLTVVASNKPLPVANDDVVADAHAGRTETVNVLANDFNPFPESALKIVSAQVETGNTTGAPSVSGSSVSVTPAESYTGVMVVRYTVEDKTGDPLRRADGRIRLTVKGKPDAPSAPRASDVRDQSAVLTWQPPADNGSPITKYTVQGSNGFRQDCAATTCTLTGLTNNVPYTFTVTATNAVGTSPASVSSNQVRPDVKPDTPAAPTVKAGDKSLAVTWTTPRSAGSPVKNYNLELSPPAPDGVAARNKVTGNSYSWTGLQNGVAYKVRVQASNDAPTPSDFSAYSAADTPAGLPGRPAAPTAASVSSVGSQSQIQVNWTQPFINGDPIKTYHVKVLRGGAVVDRVDVPGNATTTTVTAPNSESSYTFTVSAENKAGNGPDSPQSAALRASGKPGTVGTPTATPANTGASGHELDVTFQPLTASQRNGATAAEISYSYIATTGQSGPIPAGGGVIGGFTNGTATRITITAHSAASSLTGDASSPSAATRPYGNPGQPGVSGSNGGSGQQSVSFSWSAPSNRDIASTRIRFDGGAWESVNSSGSRTFGTGDYSTTHRLDVQNINSVGTAGPIASATASSGSKPPPPKTTVRVQAGTWHSCTTNGSDGAYTPPPNATCDGYPSPGGNNNLGGHWLDYADGWVDIDRCSHIFGSNNTPWYHMTSGPQSSRWVRTDTVDVNGPAIGCG